MAREARQQQQQQQQQQQHQQQQQQQNRVSLGFYCEGSCKVSTEIL